MATNSKGFSQSPLDLLPKFSFAGYTIPAESWRVRGGLRDHVHEYSHQDGGDPEKLGRSLYVVEATLNMQAKFALYPDLWPNVTKTLVDMWETGVTKELVVPSIGTIQAYAKDWTREWTYKLRSGEKVVVTFREDKTNSPVPNFIVGVSPRSISTTMDELNAVRAQAYGLIQRDQEMFDTLGTQVGTLASTEDTTNLSGNLVGPRAAMVIATCQLLDALPSMQSPRNAPLMRALHDVWVQAQAYANDVQSKNQTLQVWIVPVQMTIAAVSTGIYGDATHVNDLLSLNSGAFADPMRIQAGTEIAYYPVSQNASN